MMQLSNLILLSNMVLYDVICLFQLDNCIELSNFHSIKRQVVNFEQMNTRWKLLSSCSTRQEKTTRCFNNKKEILTQIAMTSKVYYNI